MLVNLIASVNCDVPAPVALCGGGRALPRAAFLYVLIRQGKCDSWQLNCSRTHLILAEEQYWPIPPLNCRVGLHTRRGCTLSVGCETALIVTAIRVYPL